MSGCGLGKLGHGGTGRTCKVESLRAEVWEGRVGGQGVGKAGGELRRGRWGGLEPRGRSQGAPHGAGHTSAARAAAPRLCDLQRAGQRWALQPHAADLAGLWETQLQ